MDGNNGDIFWSFGRNWCGPMEALHIKSFNGREGWTFCSGFWCDLCSDFDSMAQIKAGKTLNIYTGDLELE